MGTRLTLTQRLIGWFRRMTRSCDYGPYGCPRRPVGVWRPSASFQVRLCAVCKAELEVQLEERPLFNWTPAR